MGGRDQPSWQDMVAGDPADNSAVNEERDVRSRPMELSHSIRAGPRVGIDLDSAVDQIQNPIELDASIGLDDGHRFVFVKAGSGDFDNGTRSQRFTLTLRTRAGINPKHKPGGIASFLARASG